MRPIEFRGLRKDGKGWVYGCYSIYRGKTDGPILHRISWDDGHNGFFVEVDPSTVGQLWIHGKHKFYGGDLFYAQAAPSGGNHMRKRLCMVHDSSTGMGIRVWYKGEWWGYGKLDLTNIEMAGNIHDNPELIKP